MNLPFVCKHEGISLFKPLFLGLSCLFNLTGS